MESKTTSRVQASEKRLIRSPIDLNQLMPLKYHWAWECYTKGSKNHWIPSEIPMSADVETWRSNKLTEDERHMIKRNLGFFATAESLVATNLTLVLFKHLTCAEVRQYLLRQALEEAVHSATFLHVVESLGLEQGEIYNAYHEIPVIRDKDEFQIRLTQEMLDPNFTTETDRGARDFLRNLIGYYLLMEGLFFYTGFAMILSLRQRNLMPGICEQYELILRDEGIHVTFGVHVINTIRQEHPELWDKHLEAEVVDRVRKAIELECAYAKDCLPRGIMGINAASCREYVQCIADRRLRSIGLSPIYKSKNPFPWLSESIDLPKEGNFFESTVTEYQGGGLQW